MNTTWKLAGFVFLCAALAGACADDGEGTPACPEGFIRAGDVCIPAPDLGGDLASDVAIDAPDVGPDVAPDGPPDVVQDVVPDVVADVCTGDACPVDDVLVIYEQSFEPLSPDDSDALGNDGWFFFGSVAAADAASCTESDDCGVGISCENFAGDQVCVKFGYGPNPAPTTSGFISSLVTDQGGPEQGSRQLLVFSDYECCLPSDGHFDGTDLVETNVYQELTIQEAWIGREFTFQFDGKRGDITGATIAEAFIKTLDPNDGFRTTNEVVLDTTDLAADWGTYTVTFDMSDPRLEGQLLQFGFTTIASDFESAGNYYDNVSMSGEAAECTVDGDCDDANDCTENTCASGECVFTNNDENTCTIDSLPGACNAGVCQGLCVDVTCPEEECKTYTCDPADGECDAVNDAVNTSCDLVGGATGICDGAGNCVGCTLDSECEDSNACTDNACVEGECVFTDDDTNECSVGELPGTCEAGICIPPPICEYEQDAEALNSTSETALTDDGWLFFGNVFDSAGNFKFGFGPFGAPNATFSPSNTFISAVVTEEGDAAQGDQQLSIFNDYNCCGAGTTDEGHFNGTDRVEISVFQELTIPAAFIGQIYEFTFDAKAGNIEGATTALAFIKTLDPDASFATTNFITEDTTSLPTDWGSYTITLDMSDAALEGQILQFGFATTASDFEGSGNFYDNIAFGTQGCGGECAVDEDCPDTGNECTTAVCDAAFTCQAENVADETSCDGGDGTCSAGVCVECVLDGDCEDDNDCTDNTCDTGVCVFTNDDTNACMVGELPGACNAGVCEGLCEGVTCTDPGECAASVCDPADGVCKNENDEAGTGCDIGTGLDSGVCDGEGNCVACTLDEECEDGNDCTDNACDEGVCVFTNDDANMCMVGDDPGNCNAGVCEGLCEDVVCEDPGECQTSVCDPADGVCDTENDPINAACDLAGDPGVCDDAGTCFECNFDWQCDDGDICVDNACEASGLVYEYNQSFEALASGDPPQEQPTALALDGWLVGATVFESDGSTYAYDYFAFPAPNGGPGFSAVVVGEGGPAQGDQQLSIYSDYNNADHDNGRVIESLVFQERTIEASDVGRTYTFTFDAKAGNIEGASTALAFIKTLDPGAGFAVTNFITENTTALTDIWSTFSIEITIDAGLVGQRLQYGFQTRASDFEGSGVLYDNVSFSFPAECALDEDCPDTGSDCTTAVCDAGTCETENVSDGTACDGDTGTCTTGVCVPDILACEYDDDFEALALGSDPSNTDLEDEGWLVFANVFEADGTTFAYNYGAFAAPNGGGAFSAVVEGEGGAPQGTQQLSIFSDYNNTDHDIGRVLETIVFQERAIVAGDVGTTFTFTFDAKAGNIEGSSEALAYIKTLDPGAGFATTNFITFETTDLPTDSWGTFSLQLTIEAGLVGQLLQFGFQTRAASYEGSGIFYDNVAFCEPAECSVGADCGDTGNECTTATCTDGSCGTENDTQQGASCDGGAGTCDAGVCEPTGGDAPTTAAPTPPVRDPAEVISLFSDAYGEEPVDTWSTVWDNTTLAEPDPLIDGNAVKLYTNHTLAGIEFTGDNSIDATGMTHFHVDVWSPNATRVAFRLVDFGPDNGFDGGDDTQNNPLIEFTSGTDPALATGSWNSFDIPLATFESLGLANRANLSQLLIEGNPPGTATLYIDNVYFYAEGGGGAVELTTNGGFETGDFTGWTETCDGVACSVTDVNPNGGTYAANVVNNTPASAVLIKQANLGVGVVGPGDDISIRFFARGSAVDGGVVFAEFFSEIDGGGTSSSEILGDAPLALTDSWTEFTFDTTAGPDVSGGVTLQFSIITGGAGTSASDFYVDDVSVIIPSGGPECVVPGDCPDDDNECTTATCADSSCGTENVTQQGASCDGGAGTCNAGVCEPTGGDVELTTNGGFETGDFTGWAEFCASGTCSVTDVNPNNGSYAGRVQTTAAPANPLIKQANIGIGQVQPGSAVNISFFMRGTAVEGGIVTAELVSEFAGGGGTVENLNGGPLFPTADWVEYTFATTAGADVGGGITLQLVAVCGAVAGCAVDVYFDDVSVTIEGGGGAADILELTFDDAGSIAGWMRVADATGDEASIDWADGGGNPGGAIQFSAANPSAAAGKAYIFEYTTSGLDYAGATDVRLTFDALLGAPLVSAGVQLQTEVPGTGVVNTPDLQNQGLNESTWTAYTVDYADVNPAGDTFRIHFNLASGAVMDAGGVLLVDNIRLAPIGGGGDVPGCTDPDADNYNPDATVDDGSCTYTPSEAAPTPPVRDPAEVISLFSDAYDDEPVNTWSTVWDNTTLAEPDPLIDGNAVKLYTNHTLAGIEFTGDNSIDATGMTHFHVDVWSPNATRVAFRLVDFGPDNGFDGGDDTQNNPLIEFTSGTDPALATGTWNSFDIPLATFESLGLANRANLSQLLIEGNPPGTATLYLDNVYFWTENVVTWTPPVVFGDDFAEGVTFAGFGGSDNTLTVDTAEARPGSSGTASLSVVVPAAAYTGGSLLASAPADLTSYDAIVFWAKADADRTLDVAGFGDDTAGDITYRTEWLAIPLTTDWTEYVIPIPDPTQVDAQVGLFHFAEGSAPEGAGTIWFDDITYTTLPGGTLTNSRPEIETVENLQLNVDETYQVGGQAWTVSLDGSDQRFGTGPGYFDYLANPADGVVTVGGNGLVTAVAEGTAEITAGMAGVPATGSVTIEVIPPFDCTPIGDNLAANGNFESGDFSCVQQFLNGGTQSISDVNPAGGTYSANFKVEVVSADTLIKFANMAPGTFTVGQTIYISFDMRGSAGEVAAEFFSELTGGGTSASEQLFGGNIFPNANADTWTTFSTTALTGSDTSGGVTLLLKALSGGGTADIFFDNVCVSTSSTECAPL